MKPGPRNGLILTGILGVTFLLTLVIAYRQRVSRMSPVPSTFNASPPGLKAVYATLERLHQPVERWQHPWTKLPEQAGLLIYASPGLRPSEAECHALARWIARGHSVLLYTNPDTEWQFELAPLLEKLGMLEPSTNRTYRVATRPETDGPLEPPSREVLALPSVMPTTLTRGVRQLQIARNDGLRPERGAYVPLVVGVGNHLHALWLMHQRGQVLLFSSPSFIDNEFIRRPDNFELLLNALRDLAAGRAILFDEYHHGYSEEFAMHDFLQLPMVKWAAAQLALLMGLLIWSQWQRFGAPVPLVRETHRSVMEYAVSLGDLYARAETQLETLDYLYGNLRRELMDRHGLRTGAEIATRLDGAARQTWETLAADCDRHLQTRTLTRGRFAQLARRIQEFRRQLR